MENEYRIGAHAQILLANSQDGAVKQALKTDEVINLFKKGFKLARSSSCEIKSEVCPHNSGSDVFYVSSSEMLCIKTGNLSPESIESILSATNLSEIERANFLPRIATKEKQ